MILSRSRVEAGGNQTVMDEVRMNQDSREEMSLDEKLVVWTCQIKKENSRIFI